RTRLAARAIRPQRSPRSFYAVVGFSRIHSFLNSHSAFATPQHPARHRVELLEELPVARLRRRDQRAVERAIGADRTGFVLARKIPGKPPPHPLPLLT